jgi:hypothetical protein
VSNVWLVNASPLIALARIQCLPLLADLSRAILMPEHVLAEVEAGFSKDPAAAATVAWALPFVIAGVPVGESVAGWDLGAGEVQVITLCLPDPSRDGCLGRRRGASLCPYAWGAHYWDARHSAARNEPELLVVCSQSRAGRRLRCSARDRVALGSTPRGLGRRRTRCIRKPTTGPSFVTSVINRAIAQNDPPWLHKCVATRYIPMMEKDVGLRVRVSRDLRDAFTVACKANGQTASGTLRHFMERYVEESNASKQLELFSRVNSDSGTHRESC